MRVEQILDAIVAALTGLTTTGGNVIRGQVYDLDESQIPGLAIFMGPDILEDEISNSFYNWDLNFYVESKVAHQTTQVDEILNTIRGEVHAALIVSEPPLGLSFVIKLTPVTADEPILSGEGSKPTGTQRLEYIIKYRTSRTDLST